MSDMTDMLIDPFRRMIETLSTPAAVREVEQSRSLRALWPQIEASGFLDLLVPEEEGGAGLGLNSLFPLALIAGEHALPAPFAETVLARSLLHGGGVNPPANAAIVLAPNSLIVPNAGVATHALVEADDSLALVELAEAQGDPFGTAAASPIEVASSVATISRSPTDLLACAAALTAAAMAGHMIKLQAICIDHISTRKQFGRPLAKFQAIQQQMAVLAEQVASAVIAARIGLSGSQVDPMRAAMAKCRVSEAAHQVASIAHAVHGAIGATEEYDLQLYTRRLKQGQLAFGSESFWAQHLGNARLACAEINAADFIRLNLQEGKENP